MTGCSRRANTRWASDSGRSGRGRPTNGDRIGGRRRSYPDREGIGPTLCDGEGRGGRSLGSRTSCRGRYASRWPGGACRRLWAGRICPTGRSAAPKHDALEDLRSRPDGLALFPGFARDDSGSVGSDPSRHSRASAYARARPPGSVDGRAQGDPRRRRLDQAVHVACSDRPHAGRVYSLPRQIGHAAASHVDHHLGHEQRVMVRSVRAGGIRSRPRSGNVSSNLPLPLEQ